MEAVYCGVWPILPNRLSYPELFPTKFHYDNIYNNEEELFIKTSWALKNFHNLNQKNLMTISEQFDWQLMAPKYDVKLETI